MPRPLREQGSTLGTGSVVSSIQEGLYTVDLFAGGRIERGVVRPVLSRDIPQSSTYTVSDDVGFGYPEGVRNTTKLGIDLLIKSNTSAQHVFVRYSLLCTLGRILICHRTLHLSIVDW
jgi:hypothetical protein